GGDHALAVVKDRNDLVFGLVLVALGNVAKQLAVAIRFPMIEVAQNEWRTGYGKRFVDRAGERCAGINDIDGAETQSLVDLVLVAELRGGEHTDLVTAVGTLFDLLGRPKRLGVIGLRYLVYVRPFELGLGAGRRSGNDDCGCEREAMGQKTLPV